MYGFIAIVPLLFNHPDYNLATLTFVESCLAQYKLNRVFLFDNNIANFVKSPLELSDYEKMSFLKQFRGSLDSYNW
jgi:hypothetical protein